MTRRLRCAAIAEPEIDKAREQDIWEVLGFGSEINAVHVALLHTGDVLFFAGSGYDVANAQAHRYRTRLWHYPSAKIAPPSS